MHMYVKTYLHTDTHIKICIQVNILKSYSNIHIPTKPQIKCTSVHILINIFV